MGLGLVFGISWPVRAILTGLFCPYTIPHFGWRFASVYPTEIRTTGVGLAVGVGRFGEILGPSLFGYMFDEGLSISNLFTIFSIPLLVTGLCVWSLKSKNLR